jgi:hypothetical protein
MTFLQIVPASTCWINKFNMHDGIKVYPHDKWDLRNTQDPGVKFNDCTTPKWLPVMKKKRKTIIFNWLIKTACGIFQPTVGHLTQL